MTSSSSPPLSPKEKVSQSLPNRSPKPLSHLNSPTQTSNPGSVQEESSKPPALPIDQIRYPLHSLQHSLNIPPRGAPRVRTLNGSPTTPRTQLAYSQGVGDGTVEGARRVTRRMDGKDIKDSHSRREGFSFSHQPWKQSLMNVGKRIAEGCHHLHRSGSSGSEADQHQKRADDRNHKGEDGFEGKAFGGNNVGEQYGMDENEYREIKAGCRKNNSPIHLSHHVENLYPSKNEELSEHIETQTVTDDGASIYSGAPGAGTTASLRVRFTAHKKWEWSGTKDPAAKRALLIAIDYWRSKKDRLGGCYLDCQRMLETLVKKFEFSRSQIVVLNDLEDSTGNNVFWGVHRHENATRENIMYWLHWLVRGARPDDFLFLMFAGHGDQEKDRTETEIDGQNEMILPVDFRKRRVLPIVDDELYDEVVKKVPRKCFLFALFDCCHSGSVLDLPFTAINPSTSPNDWEVIGEQYRQLLRQRRANIDPPYITIDQNAGRVICLAGANDAGNSHEALNLEELASTLPLDSTASTHLHNRGPGGLLTQTFLEAIKRSKAIPFHHLTYRELMKHILDSFKQKLSRAGSLHVQTPILSASHAFDLDSPFRI